MADIERDPARPLKSRLWSWWRGVASGRVEPRGPGLVFVWVLVLGSIVYGVLSSFVLWVRALRPVGFDVPIVSVGNLTTGGTGKTPFVIYLARRLARAGRTVAVVSRGYGRSGAGAVVVSRGDRPLVGWREAGDEPYLIALLTRGIRVVVAARRAEGVRYAVERLGADVVLLDDGFQHVRIKRDLDVLVVDAARPVANGHLLPAGMLREHPLGVRRAGLLVATRCDRAGGARRVARTVGALAPGAPIVETRMRPIEFWDVASGETLAPSSLRGAGALALSSIADPEDFERTLEGLGIRLAGRLSFPDHHRFTGRDHDLVADAVRAAHASVILTTEKDAVRLAGWSPPVPLVALGIELDVLAGESRLAGALKAALTSGGVRADS
jgi:tetraacyldisaccharide 4'-kinase